MNEKSLATTGVQTSMFGILDQGINRVFQARDVPGKPDKDGNPTVVGVSIVMRTDKEIATALDLKGKENKSARDEAKLKESDALFRQLKGELAKMNGDWTAARAKCVTLSSGVRQVTLVVKEIKRSKSEIEWQRVAEATGLSVEELKELAEVQAAKQNQAAVELETVQS